MQETEVADMLKARISSGKSASTSAPQADGKLGTDEDSIFADLDTNGVHATCVLGALLCMVARFHKNTCQALKSWFSMLLNMKLVSIHSMVFAQPVISFCSFAHIAHYMTVCAAANA